MAGVDLMVVTPHPDDAEFGIAGTVARLVREGKTVVYVVCTSGEKGTGDRAVKPQELAKRREQEQAAAAILGVREVVFLRYEDQGLEDSAPFRKEIVRCIRTFRPHTVATTDPYRRYIWHRDHRITGRVVLDAVFPYARDHLSYPDLLEAGLEPHKVRELLFWGTDEPNYRVDITATFALKLQALRCHESQVGGHRFAAVEEWVRERARAAAAGVDFELGEMFHREEIRW
ncbi:MAG TPA: PIG-L family deacetylase [Bacillota bacterium]|nr:PIG-L family deacetylase [Bacillota bacterium]